MRARVLVSSPIQLYNLYESVSVYAHPPKFQNFQSDFWLMRRSFFYELYSTRITLIRKKIIFGAQDDTFSVPSQFYSALFQKFLFNNKWYKYQREMLLSNFRRRQTAQAHWCQRVWRVEFMWKSMSSKRHKRVFDLWWRWRHRTKLYTRRWDCHWGAPSISNGKINKYRSMFQL